MSKSRKMFLLALKAAIDLVDADEENYEIQVLARDHMDDGYNVVYEGLYWFECADKRIHEKIPGAPNICPTGAEERKEIMGAILRELAGK